MVRAGDEHKWVFGRITAALVLCVVAGSAACSGREGSASAAGPPATLRVGFGLTTGNSPEAGLRQSASIMTREALVLSTRDGRPRPWLADEWQRSDDGLTWRMHLRQGVSFHDGQALNATLVKQLLDEQLSGYMGPPFEDIEAIRAVGADTIEFALKRQSAFLLEALDLPLESPATRAGTGPFKIKSVAADVIDLEANGAYYAGPPHLGAISIRSYASLRSAWADLLRGDLDMLYEVGGDAIDSLRSSNAVKIFTHQRNYGSLVILNLRRPALKDPAVRRQLNAAIDRTTLIEQALGGHARPATSVLAADHWADDKSAPHFSYDPTTIGTPRQPLHFRLLYTEPTHERLALLLQRQLQNAGVEVVVESVPLDQALARVRGGDFDGWLADLVQGPTLLRSYWFWHSSGAVNLGQFHSRPVDEALDHIRHAGNDDEYRTGVSAFQRAIFADPPAIFLAWSDRARAVSTRFDVPSEPGHDVLGTLRFWQPVATVHNATNN